MNIAKVKAAEEGQEREVLPAGVYEVTVLDADEGETATGKPYVRLKCEVSSGPQKGRYVWDRLYQTPAALWRTRQVLEACGFVLDDLDDEFDVASLIGRRATVMTEHRDYTDREGTPKVAVDVKTWDAHPDGAGDTVVPPSLEADIPF